MAHDRLNQTTQQVFQTTKAIYQNLFNSQFSCQNQVLKTEVHVLKPMRKMVSRFLRLPTSSKMEGSISQDGAYDTDG